MKRVDNINRRQILLRMFFHEKLVQIMYLKTPQLQNQLSAFLEISSQI